MMDPMTKTKNDHQMPIDYQMMLATITDALLVGITELNEAQREEVFSAVTRIRDNISITDIYTELTQYKLMDIIKHHHHLAKYLMEATIRASVYLGLRNYDLDVFIDQWVNSISRVVPSLKMSEELETEYLSLAVDFDALKVHLRKSPEIILLSIILFYPSEFQFFFPQT